MNERNDGDFLKKQLASSNKNRLFLAKDIPSTGIVDGGVVPSIGNYLC
jgi:hypothetical protein